MFKKKLDISRMEKEYAKAESIVISKAQKNIDKYNKEIEKKEKELIKLTKQVEDSKTKEGFFKTNRAIFFDDDGEFVISKSFPKDATHFDFRGKSYLVDTSATKRKYTKNFGLSKVTEYFYHISNIYPIKLERNKMLVKITNDKQEEEYYNVINPQGLNAMLRTKLATELNKAGQKGLGELLTPTNIVIGIIVLIVLLVIGGTFINGGAA